MAQKKQNFQIAGNLSSRRWPLLQAASDDGCLGTDVSFEESQRQTKVIPRFPSEQACLTLVFAALTTASTKWRGVQVTPKILRALDALPQAQAA